MTLKTDKLIRSFGRRNGKKLSARQQSLINNLLPTILPKNTEKADILEIGFGGGEHLLDLVSCYPDNIIIGCEPFINGVSGFLSKITDTDEKIKSEYKNIRIYPDDVRILLSNTLNIKFNQIYILHPDPWPKLRHEKRRLLNTEFLNLLGKHLSENGKIIIGTDHHEYYDWVCDQLPKTDLKIKTDKLDIIKTRYQEKNKARTSAPKYLMLTK